MPRGWGASSHPKSEGGASVLASGGLLAYGVDEDDSEGHEEGDDGEGDLQDLLDDFFALDVGEATLFEQAGAVLLMMRMVMF